MTAVAPILVLGVGNPARGDDAAGPLLAERLADWLPAHAAARIEVQSDLQLNIEHVLDLAGRRRVLLIDAAVAGEAPFRCERLAPLAETSHTSHSVSPRGLLALYRQSLGAEPPATELLAIPGERFGLGEAPSPAARERLEAAWTFLLAWCARALADAEAADA